jgi:hypothetical protein
VAAVATALVGPGRAPAPSGSSVASDEIAAAGPSTRPTEPPSDPTAAATFALESPLGTTGPTRSPELIPPAPIPAGRIATRVVVSGLSIDLPVTRQTTTYPACGVAMYLMELKQPGAGGVTYLYAHAQTGNFLPIYHESLTNDGARMLGMVVDVYTGDSLKFAYRITEVRRHVTSLDGAFAWHGESVFLQTSEGPSASSPKLQVVAQYLSTEPASYDAAHPQPRPVVCR